jgi:hypothetical protein
MIRKLLPQCDSPIKADWEDVSLAQEVKRHSSRIALLLQKALAGCGSLFELALEAL